MPVCLFESYAARLYCECCPPVFTADYSETVVLLLWSRAFPNYTTLIMNSDVSIHDNQVNVIKNIPANWMQYQHVGLFSARTHKLQVLRTELDGALASLHSLRSLPCRQVCSLYQMEYSRECYLVLPISSSSVLSFT